jgi:hypothetical protein
LDGLFEGTKEGEKLGREEGGSEGLLESLSDGKIDREGMSLGNIEIDGSNDGISECIDGY